MITRTLSILLTCITFATGNQLHAQAEPKASFNELGDTITEIPRDLLADLKSPSKKAEAVIKATELLRTRVEAKSVRFKFNVERFEKYLDRNDKSERYRIRANEINVRAGGTNFVGVLWVLVRPSENEKVIALKAGKGITITGEISAASFTSLNYPELRIEVSNAIIEGK